MLSGSESGPDANIDFGYYSIILPYISTLQYILYFSRNIVIHLTTIVNGKKCKVRFIFYSFRCDCNIIYHVRFLPMCRTRRHISVLYDGEKDDERPPKRSRNDSNNPNDPSVRIKLSCPYRKRDRRKYNVHTHRTCALSSFPDTARLKYAIDFRYGKFEG
jgi:hypothetical protein